MWHLRVSQSNCRLPSYNTSLKSVLIHSGHKHPAVIEAFENKRYQLKVHFSFSVAFSRNGSGRVRDLSESLNIFASNSKGSMEVFIYDGCKIESGEIVHNNYIRLHIGLFT